MEETEKCKSEAQNVEKQMTIHFDYIDKITDSEAKRIDALTSAVALVSEKTIAQTTVLTNEVIASAEALRSLIASTNIAVTQQLAEISTQLTTRIALLEKKQYENEGRSSISVPLMMMISAITGGVVVFIIERLMGL